uniref:Uncharacterized protein n=2 Tax=Aegilops tauschii subsp. strangulata TaxID=200361 RepID=A0A453PQ32_AEGTS
TTCGQFHGLSWPCPRHFTLPHPEVRLLLLGIRSERTTSGQFLSPPGEDYSPGRFRSPPGLQHEIPDQKGNKAEWHGDQFQMCICSRETKDNKIQVEHHF